MRNILITGGAGFIGSHTVVELDAAGYRPIIVDDFSNSERFVIERLEKLIGKSLTVYEQDYKDTVKLREVIKNEDISAIIHFAAFKLVILPPLFGGADVANASPDIFQILSKPS